MPKFSAAAVCVSGLERKRNSLLAALKYSLFPVLLFACATVSQAQVSVWLQSPKPGSNPNVVLVYATAKSPNGIASWIIYVDDQVAFRGNNNSATLSQYITLKNGTHLLYARAWDSTTFGTSSTLLLQVGPQTSNLVLPNPPPNAQVLTDMQNTTDDWKACSFCAQGTNYTDNFWMAPFQSTPSMSGSSRDLFVGGPRWTNALFIKTLVQTTNVSHYLWDFWVYQDPTSAPRTWAAEFDLFHILGGAEFMIGSQCAFGDGYWETWDSANNRWIVNGIPCPRWAPETWHHIQWYVERISPTQYRYNTLTVDGSSYHALNQVWTVNPTWWPDELGIQFQLDQDETGTPLHQWIDNVKLTVW